MSSQQVESNSSLPPDEVIFGHSRQLRELSQMVDRVASANVPVLIQGESGTGKEIFAKLVHRRSPWHDGPFVKLSCPAVPSTLIESELFGYEKGAFTGAYGTKPGRVELAQFGTLFLDEIAELDRSVQAKLLQLVQDGQFCRIGAQEDRRLQARLICATHRQLDKEIERGNFRQDLFFRINVIHLRLPPLRERTEDIPDLTHYFLNLFSQMYNRPARSLPKYVMRLFSEYHWPGNIRELENLVKRYVILESEDSVISDWLVPDQSDSQLNTEFQHDGSVSLKEVTRQTVRALERKIILKSLLVHRGNRKRAARTLGISYRAILYKLKEAGVEPKRV